MPNRPSPLFLPLSPLSTLQLEVQLGAAEDALSSLGNQLQGAIKRLVEAGQLPASATEAVLSACLMGRLNPHAFPGTPQVWGGSTRMHSPAHRRLAAHAS